MILKLLSYFVFLIPPFASAETYQLELQFDFSLPTKSRAEYKGNILGHEAVAVRVDAKSLNEAVKKAESMIGTEYTEPVKVRVCNGQPFQADPKCTKTNYSSHIVGVAVYPTGNSRG